MSFDAVRAKGGVALQVALIGLVVLVGGKVWNIQKVIAQDAADAGAIAGEAAAEAVVEPLQKSLEQLVDQGIDGEVRDEKSFCMEYYHQDTPPKARNRLCDAEADTYRAYLVCKLTKDDCEDPRGDK